MFKRFIIHYNDKIFGEVSINYNQPINYNTLIYHKIIWQKNQL